MTVKLSWGPEGTVMKCSDHWKGRLGSKISKTTQGWYSLTLLLESYQFLVLLLWTCNCSLEAPNFYLITFLIIHIFVSFFWHPKAVTAACKSTSIELLSQYCKLQSLRGKLHNIIFRAIYSPLDNCIMGAWTWEGQG